MASTKEIKRRIKSVKSTKKVTKAMEMVSASKMKRAISKALASRIYASYSWDLLVSIGESTNGQIGDIKSPFFETSNEGKGRSLVILITSNRGLCGGYNSQIIKKIISMLREEKDPSKIDFVGVGKKGDSAIRKIGQNIIADFNEIGDEFSLREISPLGSLIMEEFKKKNYSKIYIAYTDFVSALNQKPKIKKLLPISRKEVKDTIEIIGKNKPKKESSSPNQRQPEPYLFEGDIKLLLETLAEKLVRIQIYQMMLESNASEQSARMMAMKNANEAAGEMIEDLTLMFNKARQARITREISEISAGMASID